MNKKVISCLLVATLIATPIRFSAEISGFFNSITAHADVSFSSLLSESSFDENDIGNSKQVVFVKSNGTSAKVYFFQKNGNEWKQAGDAYDGYVGSEGVGDASEGSSKTPKGVHRLGFCFGTEQVINNSKIDYKQATSNCYWVDDPSSIYYNRWVESSDGTKYWNSAEDLSTISVYKYCIAIEYNMYPAPIAGKGSAFFVHCSSGSATGGCVAIPEEGMKWALTEYLDKSLEPKIVIY